MTWEEIHAVYAGKWVVIETIAQWKTPGWVHSNYAVLGSCDTTPQAHPLYVSLERQSVGRYLTLHFVEPIRPYDDHSFEDSGPALHHAAFRGNIEVLRDLIESGYPIEMLDRSGTTAIHAAAMENRLEAVRFLIQKGANVNHACSLNSKFPGHTALRWAAHSASPEMVRLLLEAGADRNARAGTRNETPLELAVRIQNNNPTSVSEEKIAILKEYEHEAHRLQERAVSQADAQRK